MRASTAGWLVNHKVDELTACNCTLSFQRCVFDASLPAANGFHRQVAVFLFSCFGAFVRAALRPRLFFARHSGYDLWCAGRKRFVEVSIIHTAREPGALTRSGRWQPSVAHIAPGPPAAFIGVNVAA